MRHKNPIVLITIMFFFISCSKQNKGSKNSGDGYWMLGSKQYTIGTTERSTNNGYFLLSGFDTAVPSNSLNFYFPLVPAASGKFKVIAFKENVTLKTKELAIKLNVPSTGIYSSTGTADSRSWLIADSADVTINNGKITVQIPQMCTIILTPTYLDSVLLKGVLIEK